MFKTKNHAFIKYKMIKKYFATHQKLEKTMQCKNFTKKWLLWNKQHTFNHKTNTIKPQKALKHKKKTIYRYIDVCKMESNKMSFFYAPLYTSFAKYERGHCKQNNETNMPADPLADPLTWHKKTIRPHKAKKKQKIDRKKLLINCMFFKKKYHFHYTKCT